MSREFKRVKSKHSGDEFTVQVVDRSRHDVIDKPATDANGRPLPAKPKTPISSKVPKSKPTTTTPEEGSA